jgi:leucine-zipper of insertion element IS481
MTAHQNARLTPLGRERIVRTVLGGRTPQTAAQDAESPARTARKWARFKAEGLVRAGRPLLAPEALTPRPMSPAEAWGGLRPNAAAAH